MKNFHLLRRWIAGGVGQLVGAEQLAGLGVWIGVRKFIGDYFADLRAKNVVEKLQGGFLVGGVGGDAQIVDELMQSLGRQDILEFMILLPADRGLAAPDDAQIDIAVYQ